MADEPDREKPSRAATATSKRLQKLLDPPAFATMRKVDALLNSPTLQAVKRMQTLATPTAVEHLVKLSAPAPRLPESVATFQKQMRAASAQATAALGPTITAMHRLQARLGQALALTEGPLAVLGQHTRTLVASMAEALAPVRSAVEQMNSALRLVQPQVGRVLEQMQTAMRANLGPEWFQALTEGFRAFEEAIKNAEVLGELGWTVPLNASVPECVTLLRAATTAEVVDEAFVNFYTKENGAHRAELVQDLLGHPELRDWSGLLDEVAWAVEAGKYRVPVPALLVAFEGAANRSWNPRFREQGRRSTFFKKKLASFEPGSYDYIMWSAMRAFVNTLYEQAPQTKPLRLNRHWTLHGEGPADASLADCLRLLQAIHTVACDEVDA